MNRVVVSRPQVPEPRLRVVLPPGPAIAGKEDVAPGIAGDDRVVRSCTEGGGAEGAPMATVLRAAPDWIVDDNSEAAHSGLGHRAPVEYPRAQQEVLRQVPECLANRGEATIGPVVVIESPTVIRG